jgi:hypothetical protein
MSVPPGIGIGLRSPLSQDILERPPPELAWLEICPENYMRRGGRFPATLAQCTVKLTATFNGPPSSPSSVHITTDAPILISLKEHDVKPRDVTGKFLNGALEKVGKKIDDTDQLSLDVTASAGVVASTH